MTEDAARTRIREAMISLAQLADEPTTTQPGIGGARAGRRAADPEAAGHELRQTIPQARAAGHSWDKIAEILGLGEGYADRAEAAFDFVCPHDSNWASLWWDCPSCGHRVRDRGPFSGPASDQEGHADGCKRLADEIAADEAQRDE